MLTIIGFYWFFYLKQYLCAQCALSNISINEYYQFFMGAKGGDARQ